MSKIPPKRASYHIPFEEYGLENLAKLSKCLRVFEVYFKAICPQYKLPDLNISVLQPLTQKQFKQAFLVLNPIVVHFTAQKSTAHDVKASLLGSINFKVNLLNFCYCYFWVLDNVLKEDPGLVDMEHIYKFAFVFKEDCKTSSELYSAGEPKSSLKTADPSYDVDPLLIYFPFALSFKYNAYASFKDLQTAFSHMLVDADYLALSELESSLLARGLVEKNSLFGVKPASEPIDMSDSIVVKEHEEWAFDTYETDKMLGFYKLLDFYGTKFLDAWVRSGVSVKTVIKYVEQNSFLDRNFDHWMSYLQKAQLEESENGAQDSLISKKKSQVYKKFAKKHPHMNVAKLVSEDEIESPKSTAGPEMLQNLKAILQNSKYVTFGKSQIATLVGILLIIVAILFKKKGTASVKWILSYF